MFLMNSIAFGLTLPHTSVGTPSSRMTSLNSIGPEPDIKVEKYIFTESLRFFMFSTDKSFIEIENKGTFFGSSCNAW